VLERREYTSIHVEYWLTASGLDVWRLLVAMWAWERRWVEASRLSQPAPVHTVCGQPTAPQLVCGHCRLPTTPRDTVTVLAARASDFMTDSSLRRRRSSKRHEPTDPALLFPETMALIGDRTSALIIALSFLGVRRFRDFARQLEVSPSVLTDRLQRLVRQGVLERRMPASGGHAEYRLTVKGMDFFPVTVERQCTSPIARVTSPSTRSLPATGAEGFSRDPSCVGTPPAPATAPLLVSSRGLDKHFANHSKFAPRGELDESAPRRARDDVHGCWLVERSDLGRAVP
jgi:DNA-binding HxlR family transcriptional regulator